LSAECCAGRLAHVLVSDSHNGERWPLGTCVRPGPGRAGEIGEWRPVGLRRVTLSPCGDARTADTPVGVVGEYVGELLAGD